MQPRVPTTHLLLICGLLFALGGCIEGVSAEPDTGAADLPDQHDVNVDAPVAVFPDTRPGPEAQLADTMPPPIADQRAEASTVDGGRSLEEAVSAYAQALMDAGSDICTCLTDSESEACIASPSKCFSDQTTCMAAWTLTSAVQSCMVATIPPSATTAIIEAVDCLRIAGDALELCVKSTCTEDIFACMATYSSENVVCIMPVFSTLSDAVNDC